MELKPKGQGGGTTETDVLPTCVRKEAKWAEGVFRGGGVPIRGGYAGTDKTEPAA